MGSRGRLRAVMAVVAVALIGMVLGAPGAEAATGTVNFRGSVTCPEGQKFMGAWVNSSGGKSDFANKLAVPGTGNTYGYITRTLSGVTLPTTVSLNVGCGVKSGNQWRYVYNKVGAVKATASGTVFINVGCTTAKCTTAARGLGGSTTRNPATESDARTLNGQEWCTWRASEFWKQMTGSYPGWSGNAGAWDDNAPSLKWNVRNWPEPDSLMVTQPKGGGDVGHVGYVAQIRVKDGKTQVKFYDRNADGKAYNRSIYDRPRADHDGWVGIPAGAKFVRVPPRFTSHNR